ncbi:MAG: hypothetical protein ABIS50_08720 [Luteolibacter sp.]|uniref:hypothetical protein n=1 Tax=Luteolibacter sp. TaxID=1962973 RepID=UPI0032666C45
MIDPFTRTRYHSGCRLDAWFPDGVLDITMATLMVHYVGFEEAITDEPFNRFADLSKLTAIHLEFSDVARIAAERRASYDGPQVKSAFLATNLPAYGVARMFAALMEPSSIEVQVFRKIEDAAEWLGVPPDVLREE